MRLYCFNNTLNKDHKIVPVDKILKWEMKEKSNTLVLTFSSPPFKDKPETVMEYEFPSFKVMKEEVENLLEWLWK